jgi:hypothetical protein
MHRKYRTHETLGNRSDIAAFKAAVHPQSRTSIVLRAAGVFLTGRVVPVIGTVSFGYSGEDGVGDRLLAAVLRGGKAATSSLAVEYPYGERSHGLEWRRSLPT